MESRTSSATGRRTLVGRRNLIKTGAALGMLQFAAPNIIAARGETPIKLGWIDPLTGVLSILAVTEVEGAKLAVEQINQSGGVLGRQLQLLVEDSANDVGTGVQKAHKLIERDQVAAIFADVNSAIAYAVEGVTSEKKIFHIVPGGHTDPITGKDCKWNVFRICNTTAMDAAAITQTLVSKFGKKFYFITPDYAYGHTLQENFVKRLKALGGTYQGDMLPINTSDFSAALIKAKAYKPDVLLNNMGGLAQIDCMKQFTQFGLQKSMALGGALFELESVLSVPPDAQTGWWTMEWWWNQPGVPHVAEFVAAIKKATGKPASARHWFGYVAIHSFKIAAEKAKSMDALAMSRALENEALPPEVALQPGKISYRAGDHELMATIFAGEVHPPKDDPANVFTVGALVSGEEAAGPVADTGCHMIYPA
jgi:branched-chain amino acid transport system substrate-binding protein